MSCGKLYDKLWQNYIAKYGDFRERLQSIQNDNQCFMQFQLPRLKRPSSNICIQSSIFEKKSIVDNNEKLLKKNNSSIIKDDYLSSLNQNDLNELENLIEAEDFPNNIFPINNQSENLENNEIELSTTQLISSSNSHQSIEKFEHGRTSQLVLNTHDMTSNRITNPYIQLIERLHKTENPEKIIDHKSSNSMIDTNLHIRIKNLLSFLHSLDDTTDNKEQSNIVDENTLLNLFSIDNQLSASLKCLPTNIHQLNIIPKTILQSLKNTSDNRKILNKIQAEIAMNKKKELFNSKTFKNSNLLPNIIQRQSYSNNDAETSSFIEQDNELNSKLRNTYTIKAFKEFLINHKNSTRLPKLFQNMDQ